MTLTGGCVVEEVRTGEEALGILTRHGCRLGLLDVTVPVGSAMYARRIRRMLLDNGMVMGARSRGRHSPSLKAGADGYVTQPVKLCQLAARLRGMAPRSSTRSGFGFHPPQDISRFSLLSPRRYVLAGMTKAAVKLSFTPS